MTRARVEVALAGYRHPAPRPLRVGQVILPRTRSLTWWQRLLLDYWYGPVVEETRLLYQPWWRAYVGGVWAEMAFDPVVHPWRPTEWFPVPSDGPFVVPTWGRFWIRRVEEYVDP